MVPVTAWDWTCIKLWSPPGYRGLKRARNVIRGKLPFQLAYIYLLFDVRLIRLVCLVQFSNGELSRGAGFDRTD